MSAIAKLLNSILKYIKETLTTTIVQSSTGAVNRLQKIEIDLSTARTDVALGLNGSFLQLWQKGDGDFVLTIVLDNGAKIGFNSLELQPRDKFYVKFSDIKFTNTAQTGVTNPILLVGWIE